MKLKLLIVFTLLAGIVSAQTNLVSYEYWFNDDYDNVQIETISPAPQHELNKNIDVTFLPNYVNVLNVRYKDENGNYSSTFSKFFLKLGDTETPESNNLVSYEYWFNDDYANVQTETIFPMSQHILNTNIDVTALPNYVNVLNIRYKDQNGKYSSTFSKFFLKLGDTETPESNNLVSYEYWFNDDYANVQTETISPTSQHILNTNIDVTALPNHVNVLNIRYKDQNGKYSSTFSKFFLKLGDTETPETPGTNNLVSYEYWFNEDYANVHIETISPTAQHILNTNIDITDLPDNLNVLNIRYKDENGKYSSTLSKLFVKLSEDHIVDNQIIDNKLTHYMYWFDDDFSNATTVTLPQNVPNHNWVQLLTLPSDMEGGNHKINIRYKDSLNLWSVPFAKTFFKNYYPRAVFNGMENALCFGTMLEVTPNAIDVDSIYWNFGDGTPIEGKTPETLIQHLYDSEGTYNITATMKHLASGVTNDTTFAITVYPNYSSLEVSLSVCESDLPYSFGTQSLTTTGVYTETFQTVYGCDSTVTAHFTVNPVYDNSETVYICSGSDYTFHDDTILNNITESTSHVSHLQTVNGCDSIITTYLYVNPVYDNTETVYICSGSDYTFHDGTTQPDITSDISHVNYLQTVDGCDSIITTYLYVNPVYDFVESIDICSGTDYTFHDGTIQMDITENTSHVSFLQTVNGCDSVITTNLIVNPVYANTETVYICSGSDYTFHDDIALTDITSDTSHVSHLQSINGCDSIITTYLYVNPNYDNTETVYICSGSDYTFHDGTTQPDITSNISHVNYLQTINGCDSVITTNLIVNPVYANTETVYICSGSDYTFHDGITHTDITSDISYVSHLQSVNGCDSVITTNLIVNPVYANTETVYICSGSDYTFHDGITLNDIVENTSYVSHLQSINGCDSIIFAIY
ncbi:MAG: PKD domain-containing protein [Bacteroidales bacterium]